MYWDSLRVGGPRQERSRGSTGVDDECRVPGHRGSPGGPRPRHTGPEEEDSLRQRRTKSPGHCSQFLMSTFGFCHLFLPSRFPLLFTSGVSGSGPEVLPGRPRVHDTRGATAGTLVPTRHGDWVQRDRETTPTLETLGSHGPPEREFPS